MGRGRPGDAKRPALGYRCAMGEKYTRNRSYLINCKECEELCVRTSPKAIFCSSKCSASANKRSLKERGIKRARPKYSQKKTFRDTGVYPEHSGAAPLPTQKNCLFCGDEFQTLAPTVAKYCSGRCASIAQNRKTRILVNEYKVKMGCVDCGYNAHHAALEFDHVRGEKLRNVSTINGINLAKKEIEKCDVRCSNCHRIKTWNDLQIKKQVRDLLRDSLSMRML